MHFALNKRAVDIDFIAYLAIRPVKWIFDQGQPVGIQKRLARVVFSQRAASGMTTTAGIDLRRIGKRLSALSDARTLSLTPLAPGGQAHVESGLSGGERPLRC